MPKNIINYITNHIPKHTGQNIINQINSAQHWINICPKTQTLTIFDQQQTVILKSKISTAKNGLGEQKDSFKTPRGWHIIRAKIGHNHPPGAVFQARRWTKEIFTPQLKAKYPQRDFILTRILWLSGMQPGFNRLGNTDSMNRFIYIHGTSDTQLLGQPHSHGCIRMNDENLIKLFDIIKPYTPVFIDHI